MNHISPLNYKLTFMKRLHLFLVMIFPIIIYSSCESDVLPLYLDNIAGFPISCYVADGLNTGFSYPTICLPSELSDFCLTENISGSAIIYERDCWDYEDLVSTTHQGILSIYIFDQRIVDSNGWEDVLSNNRYVVRYDLTAADLDLLKGHLSFPPNEAMKDIEMAPPYSSFTDKTQK